MYDVTTDWSRRADGNVEERRVEVVESECPDCGSIVFLESKTDRWIQDRAGTWRHSGYGEPQGKCFGCGVLIVNDIVVDEVG
jgi:hypothetical protein